MTEFEFSGDVGLSKLYEKVKETNVREKEYLSFVDRLKINIVIFDLNTLQSGINSKNGYFCSKVNIEAIEFYRCHSSLSGNCELYCCDSFIKELFKHKIYQKKKYKIWFKKITSRQFEIINFKEISD